MRGNHSVLLVMPIASGTIPACAGEPVEGKADPHFYGDYPRVCGGTLANLRRDWSAQGLSPRVRGNLCISCHQIATERTIPACAGEPRAHPRPERLRKDYPRVCGGTIISVEDRSSMMGLSPRVRGNQSHSALPASVRGTIPACAGEPLNASTKCCQTEDYPRVCGGTSIVSISSYSP